MGEDASRGDMARYTVPDAARVLGISPEAVRNRLSRGTLESLKEGRTVFVLLPRSDTSRQTGDTPIDRSADTSADAALVDVLTEQTRYLREQLRREQEAHAEARRLLAAALERIPAIEAPSEPRESPESATDEPERAEPRPNAEGTQEGAQRRSWWRRIIGS